MRVRMATPKLWMNVGRCCLVALFGIACGRTDLDGSDWLADEKKRREREARRCQQVDFLFVVGNTRDMAVHQRALINHYRRFVDGVREAVGRVQSIHLGVTTTSSYKYNNSHCRKLGGLVVETNGEHSSRRACGPYAEGFNYMTDADEHDGTLDESFRCAVKVGTEGLNSEQSVLAAISAVSTPYTDVGSCNHGFMRPGALLVVVFVVNEDTVFDPEHPYIMNPLTGFISFAEAKGDRERDVVVVTLANGPDSGCEGEGYGAPATQLEEMTSYFSYGFTGPVCAKDFGAVFEDAIAVVEDACPVPEE